jgi:hypothetical protein
MTITPIADNSGHEIAGDLQSEDRLSRASADIKIRFLEAMAGEKLQPWHREIVEMMLQRPQQMIVHRVLGRMTLGLRPYPPPPPPPPKFFE